MAEQIETSLVRFWKTKELCVGAGFLVTNKRIVTCAHVVITALGSGKEIYDVTKHHLKLDFPMVAKGRLLEAEVVFWQPPSNHNGDMAVLEIQDELPVGVSSARMIRANDLWGHSFRVLGFPDEFGGVVHGEIRSRLPNGWIQIEARALPIETGFSGAPVWDDQLDGVVGMVVATRIRSDAKVAYMIPTSVLIENWHPIAEQAQLIDGLSNFQYERLEKELETLKQEWNLRIRIIQRLRSALAIEGDISTKFKMELQFEEQQNATDALKEKIEQIESQLQKK